MGARYGSRTCDETPRAALAIEVACDEPPQAPSSDGASVALYGDRGREADRKHFFTFDSVLLPGASEQQTYDLAARPSIDSLMEGYNRTIFAYG